MPMIPMEKSVASPKSRGYGHIFECYICSINAASNRVLLQEGDHNHK
jgi:hypothetical protein